MEYIFGTKLYDGKYCEFLQTKGENYTELEPGAFVSHVIETEQYIIEHKFRVLFRFKVEEDLEGNFCTWYYIDNHTTDIDRTPGINASLVSQQNQLNEQSNAIDDILIDLLSR